MTPISLMPTTGNGRPLGVAAAAVIARVSDRAGVRGRAAVFPFFHSTYRGERMAYANRLANPICTEVGTICKGLYYPLYV